MKIKTKRKSRTPRILTGNNKALKVVCEDVEFGYHWVSLDITRPVLPDSTAKVIRDMLYCLVKRKYGVGLAANQIGSNLRIIIVKTVPSYKNGLVEAKYKVMINPVILDHSEKTTNRIEGCLSWPGITKYVTRYKLINVEYLNEAGAKILVQFEDESARIVQHEIDHLNGVCKIGENS